MPLILRSVKGSKLTISEMDGNLTYLASTLSGSIIQVTGSSIDAPNTSITASSFIGSGSGIVGVVSSSYAITASYTTTSSYALTASYVNPLNQIVQITGSLSLSGSGFINSSSILQMPQYINITGNTRRLLSGSITSVDWGTRYLQGANGDLSIAWGSRVLNKYNFGTGNSWPVVNWDTLQLNDNTELTSQVSVDWGNRVLYDSTGNDSIDWENRALKDTSAGNVVEWDTNIFQPSDDDAVSLGDPSRRFRNGYVSRIFTVGDPSIATTSLYAFSPDGVNSVGGITMTTGSTAPTNPTNEGSMFVGKVGANYYINVFIGGRWRSSSLS